MKKIITVSREFGSGGHSIAKAVAVKRGYAFYDEAIVNEVAKRCGYSPEFVEESGEYAASRHSLLFTLATANRFTVDGLSAADHLYIEQAKVIEELAEKGYCVIVGRCADYILRERKEALHVFIRADVKSRAAHVLERYGETEKALEKRIEDKDRKRKVYYRNYTGRTWGEAQNYDLCLNSGALGIELCTELIVQAAK